MEKVKLNNEGDYCYIFDPITDQQIEEYSKMTLDKFKISTTVAYGTCPALLTQLLERFNNACKSNNTDVVKKLGMDLLESGATRYIEASKIEIILAVACACSAEAPFLTFEGVYDFLWRRYYPRQVNSIEEMLDYPLPKNNN